MDHHVPTGHKLRVGTSNGLKLLHWVRFFSLVLYKLQEKGSQYAQHATEDKTEDNDQFSLGFDFFFRRYRQIQDAEGIFILGVG
jgi:hypothetical protein